MKLANITRERSIEIIQELRNSAVDSQEFEKALEDAFLAELWTVYDMITTATGAPESGNKERLRKIMWRLREKGEDIANAKAGKERAGKVRAYLDRVRLGPATPRGKRRKKAGKKKAAPKKKAAKKKSAPKKKGKKKTAFARDTEKALAKLKAHIPKLRAKAAKLSGDKKAIAEEMAASLEEYVEGMREVVAANPGTTTYPLHAVGGLEEVLRRVRSPQVRKRISSLLNFKPVEIYPSNGFLRFTRKHASAFDPRSFRTDVMGGKSRKSDRIHVLRACPKGFWGPRSGYVTRAGKRRKGKCGLGMETQRVDVPWSKVVKALKPRKKGTRRRRAANPVEFAPQPAQPLMPGVPPEVTMPPSAFPPVLGPPRLNNPLLMTVENPGYPYPIPGQSAGSLLNGWRSNPGLDIPFRPGQKIARDRFEGWLYGTQGIPGDWIRNYERAIEEYTRFHLGTAPEHVTFDLIELGGEQMLPPEFMYSAGKSPAETYTPDSNSGKSPASYVHEYETQPDVLVGLGGRYVLKPLRGTALVTDWFYG